MSRRAFERQDLRGRWAAWGLGGLLVLMLFGAGLMFGFVRLIAPGQPPGRPAQQAAHPGPDLEADPLKDRLALDKAAQAHLSGYGPSSLGPGFARIPIARAMALQAQRGWPDAGAGR